MKLGLLTAALPGMDLDALATWAAESGYQMLEIACWPAGKAERRYAGVSHIDVGRPRQGRREGDPGMLAGNGLDISSLAYYPNPLDARPDARRPRQSST